MRLVKTIEVLNKRHARRRQHGVSRCSKSRTLLKQWLVIGERGPITIALQGVRRRCVDGEVGGGG